MSKQKDLLKEAIADAKAVRETALKNAKLALEEAFTPQLQSMLSAKLQKEVEDDDEEIIDDEPEVEDVDVVTDTEDTDDESEENFDDEDSTEEVDIEVEDEDEEPEVDVDVEDEEEIEEDAVTSDIGDGDNEMPTENPPTRDPGEDELFAETEEEDELDLDAIIQELEDDEEIDIDITEDDDVPMRDDESTEDLEEETEIEDDEEISLDEILKALREEDEIEVEEEPIEEPEMQSIEESKKLRKELTEAYGVIKFMKSKLNEVNLVNAKLLFTNKLFKHFVLSENQKLKIVETLDRASNVKEAKLVYVTIAESLKTRETKKVPTKVRTITEGLSSKATVSTKPSKEILSESNDIVSRFQKLANIKK